MRWKLFSTLLITAASLASVPAFSQSTVTIGGTVFLDLDKDAVFEPGSGEIGFDGVLLQLRDGSGTPLPVPISTSGGGHFQVTLPAGSYTVELPLDNVSDDSPLFNYALVSEQDGVVDGRHSAT